MTEMVGWYHQLDSHEFEQALGVGDGQGSLAYHSPWSRKESGTTERPNRNDLPALDRELPETWITSSASPLILSLFPFASCVCVSHKMQSHTLSVIKKFMCRNHFLHSMHWHFRQVPCAPEPNKADLGQTPSFSHL